MTEIWDDPEIKVVSEYVKFNTPGDHIAGTVTGVVIHRWDDGSACPKVILIDDATGEETSFTAGQFRLRAALSEQRPAVGDHIAVTYTGEFKMSGGRTGKDFDVQITRGGATATPVAQPEVSELTQEQQAALAALKASGVI